MLLDRGGNAVNQEARDRRDIGFDDAEWADAVDPHHRRGGVANDAAGTAGVRRCDDGGEIADMDFALEDMPSHRAADQGRCDVVEKARQHEHDGEQHKPAGPTVRQERWHLVRDAAVLEVPRQDRKAHQQQEQVGEDHPLVVHLQHEAAEALSLPEAGEEQLVDGDHRKPGQRDLQRLVMEDRDAEQRQAEQNEINRDAEQVDGLC